jgi:hypothetical protein
MVRSALARRSALSFEKAFSIGLKSGLYGGSKLSVAPACSIAPRTPAALCAGRLMGWTPPHGIAVPKWCR